MDTSKIFRNSPVAYGKTVLTSARQLDNVSIAGFVILAQLFVLLSAPHMWADEAIQDMFMYYFVMLAFAFAILGREGNPLYSITLSDGIVQYVTAFVVGLFVFSELITVPGSGNFGGYGTLTSLVIAQTFVVAICEEMLFRGALPKTFQQSNVGYGASRLISCSAFALFHGWAYNWNIVLMASAFFFGLIMQYFWDGGAVNNKKVGWPLLAVGLHASWNVVMDAGQFSMWVTELTKLGGL